MAARRKKRQRFVSLFNLGKKRNPWEHDPAAGGSAWTSEGHWEWAPDFKLRVGPFLYKIPYDWKVRDQVAKKLGYKGSEPMAWFQIKQSGSLPSAQAAQSLMQWLDASGFERSRKQASNPRRRRKSHNKSRRHSKKRLRRLPRNIYRTYGSRGNIIGGPRKKVLKLLAILKKALKSKNPAPLGTGARFKALVKKLKARKGHTVRDSRALAAWIGRRKYGAKKFKQLAARGKWRHRVAGLARRKAANPKRKSRNR